MIQSAVAYNLSGHSPTGPGTCVRLLGDQFGPSYLGSVTMHATACALETSRSLTVDNFVVDRYVPACNSVLPPGIHAQGVAARHKQPRADHRMWLSWWASTWKEASPACGHGTGSLQQAVDDHSIGQLPCMCILLRPAAAPSGRSCKISRAD